MKYQTSEILTKNGSDLRAMFPNTKRFGLGLEFEKSR